MADGGRAKIDGGKALGRSSNFWGVEIGWRVTGELRVELEGAVEEICG